MKLKKIFKADTLIYLVTLGICIILLVKYFYSINSINKFQKENDLLLHELNFKRLENTVQEALIGTKLQFNTLYSMGEEKNFGNLQKSKVAVIADVSACQPCYRTALLFYTNYLDKDHDSSTNLCLIVPSRNIKYIKTTFHKEFKSGVNIIADTLLSFSKQLNIPINNSAVLFLDKNNECLYAYLVEKEKPQKNAQKSKIFERLLLDTDRNNNVSSLVFK